MRVGLRPVYSVATLCALLLFSAPSYAFRCGTRVISEGDHQPRVLQLCGDPTHIETWQEERVFKSYYQPYETGKRVDPGIKSNRQPFYVKEFVTVQRWTYNRGSHRLVRYLTFENGVLVRIIAGEHGY